MKSLRHKKKCLNPCYTGCASSAYLDFALVFNFAHVLILVILDVPLRLRVHALFVQVFIVLILVILDVPLRLSPQSTERHLSCSLNPCYTGCASSAFYE